jgi:hypothetical protein
MSWSYKTVRFDLKKDGILGSAFLDESEIEITLNEFGRVGWELVSFIEVQEGLLAVFKMFNETFVKINRNAIIAEEEGQFVSDAPEPDQLRSSAHEVSSLEEEKVESVANDSSEVQNGAEESTDGDVGAIRIE